MSPTHVAVFDFSSKLKYMKGGGGIQGKQLVLVLALHVGRVQGCRGQVGSLVALGAVGEFPWCPRKLSVYGGCPRGTAILCSNNSSHISGFYFIFFAEIVGSSCHLSGSRFPHLKK